MADERARLAIVLQRIAPDLVAHLWPVPQVRDLPLDVRETVADLLGWEAASRGLDEDEGPNAYGLELDLRRARAVTRVLVNVAL